MPNLFDYLEWRGDLTFEEAPLCEVDNLMFSLLSYVDLDGIVPAPRKGGILLREAAKEYFFVRDQDPPKPLGLIVPAEIVTLFRRMAETRRYAMLPLGGYVNEICEEREMQFSALSVRLPDDSYFVAYRGTDDTIVGWREDFNMSFMVEVPSQRKAVDYLSRLDFPPDSDLYLGGHSKGGNLAVYAASHAPEKIQCRIRRAYSNDGPGFTEDFLKSEAYRAVADRVVRLIPDDSLVGLLLEHDESYTVIKSSRKGLFQHDGLSWEVMGSRFLRGDGLSKRGVHSDTVVWERIDSMTRAEKQTFVQIMFTILESTGAKTLTELYNGSIRTALSMLKTYTGLSPEDRETAAYLWNKLFGGKSAPVLVQKNIPVPAVTPPRRVHRIKNLTIEWFPAFH